MVRIWGLGAVALLMLTACHGPRATIVPNDPHSRPTCHDGADENAPPYEWICPRAEASIETVKRTSLRHGRLAATRSDFVPMPTWRTEAASAAEATLLIPAGFPVAVAPEADETAPGEPSVEERIAMRKASLPVLPPPPIIDIEDILRLLRGTVD